MPIKISECYISGRMASDPRKKNGLSGIYILSNRIQWLGQITKPLALYLLSRDRCTRKTTHARCWRT